ncbi:PREDICTED: uncharacterized protein LOC109181236 [Ipomoea nil]|uniref:uncharacterized protein LOC109181236 n=1 Tax=Ipomoea nil TaxID=35883 RepID=UPI00090179D2|nr:PREDICTED: uncharacterized protein LOC109181236 [Ipomoea nil]
MWKLKVPPKWKTFLWRAICDILPTTTNLIIKRVEVDPLCPMCALDHEDVLHALVLCEYSTLVWNITQLPITNIVTDSFSTWLTTAVTVLTEEQTRLMIAVLYSIWRSRNAAVWEWTMARLADVVKGAAVAERAFGAAHYRHPLLEPTPSSGQDQHETGATLRCYVDAGFRQGTGEATYGIVLISPEGTLVPSENGKLQFCNSPLMAEALAYKESLSWLAERNITLASCLTDCMVLWSTMQQQTTPIYSYVGVVIDQCRTIMSLFSSISLSYVPRQINLHAHTLASLAFPEDYSMYWDSIPPDSIIALIN